MINSSASIFGAGLAETAVTERRVKMIPIYFMVSAIKHQLAVTNDHEDEPLNGVWLVAK
jgi:hypothetical protein